MKFYLVRKSNVDFNGKPIEDTFIYTASSWGFGFGALYYAKLFKELKNAQRACTLVRNANQKSGDNSIVKVVEYNLVENSVVNF